MKVIIQFIIVFCFNNPITINSQNIDSIRKNKIELFNSGFLDIMNSGQVNSSARLLKLNIGEPNKFYLPLSFYGGITNNPMQGTVAPNLKSNDHLITGYINPLSGLINFSFEDILFPKFSKNSITKFGFSYQVGERVMYGIRVDTINKQTLYSTVNFLNSYLSTGLFFQTQAWERDKKDNLGIFWLSVRYHLTATPTKQLKTFLPNISTNGVYTGYSFGFGINITNSVDIKAIYYNYLKKPEIDYYNSIYQFTLNYTNSK